MVKEKCSKEENIGTLTGVSMFYNIYILLSYHFIVDCGWCSWVYTECTGCSGNCYGTQSRSRTKGCPAQAGSGATCAALTGSSSESGLACFICKYMCIVYPKALCL